MKTIIFVLLVFFAFIKCASPDINKPGIDEKDNSNNVIYKANTQFSIVLEGNLSTGYSWEIASIDTTKVMQVGNYEYIPNPNDRMLVGAPGKFVFKFKTLSKGSSLLKFYYLRPWEKGIAPIDTFEKNINIK